MNLDMEHYMEIPTLTRTITGRRISTLYNYVTKLDLVSNARQVNVNKFIALTVH